MTAALWIDLAKAVAWPLLTAAALIAFRRPLSAILNMLERRIDAGASFKFYSVEVGPAPVSLPRLSPGEAITENHLALNHTSWRYPRKDAEFGRRMWGIHVIVQARDDVLDRIDYVKYFLDKSYPNAVQVITDRASKFKLKELANGESTIHAEVKVKGQEAVVNLSRYINLADSGPRI